MRDTTKTETDSRVGEVDQRPGGDEPVSRAEYTRERAEHARELAALRAEVQRLGAVSGSASAPADRARFVTRTGDSTPRRRRRRARAAATVETAERGAPVSRRRLFGLLGGAAAVGTGLAVAGSALGADPAGATAVTAGAADGDALQIGGVNLCSSLTLLLSTTTSNALAATATGTDGTGFYGQSFNGSVGTGVRGVAVSGYGLRGQGGRAPLFLDSAASAGAPTTGLHGRGEFWVDTNTGDDHHTGTGSSLFYCVASGTPGTWVNLTTGSQLVTIPPARVYDSRVSQSPTTGPKSPITNGSTVTVDVTGTQATPPGGPSGVPLGVSSVLGNVTLVAPSNQVFLTLYAAGTTQPSTSNINGLAGGVVANNFTSKLGSGGSANQIAITCGGGPTDFIIDIFGYYL
jgi:hypothetical protein